MSFEDDIFKGYKTCDCYQVTEDWGSAKKGEIIFWYGKKVYNCTITKSTGEVRAIPHVFVCRIKKGQFKTLKELMEFVKNKVGE